MKETNCGFAGGLDATAASAREMRRFMLLVHKFPVNGARMSRRPPFCVLPRYRHPSPHRRNFLFCH